MDSDSDFEESGANSRGGMSLRFAINRARRYIKRARARGEGRLSGVAGELAETFPCHSRSPARAPSRGSKKRKIQRWRYIPVCLQSPFMSIVPTKGTLDTLCEVGLGSKWLCAEDRLSLGVEVSSEEFILLFCVFFRHCEILHMRYARRLGLEIVSLFCSQLITRACDPRKDTVPACIFR